MNFLEQGRVPYLFGQFFFEMIGKEAENVRRMEANVEAVLTDPSIMEVMSPHLDFEDIVRLAGINKKIRKKMLHNPRKDSRKRLGPALKLKSRIYKTFRKKYKTPNPLSSVLKQIHQNGIQFRKRAPVAWTRTSLRQIKCTICLVETMCSWGKYTYGKVRRQFKIPTCKKCYWKTRYGRKRKLKIQEYIMGKIKILLKEPDRYQYLWKKWDHWLERTFPWHEFYFRDIPNLYQWSRFLSHLQTLLIGNGSLGPNSIWKHFWAEMIQTY